jgi:SAM-dependent methyltransferase
MGMATPPTGDRVGRHYQGTLGAEYFGWQREGAQLGAELERFKFAPHVGPGDVLVEFGCGTGYLLELLSAAEKVGVEVNEVARADASARGLRIVTATDELPDAYADVAISNHALEHTLAPLQELRELHRVLKPGGRLVLWLPLDDWRTQRKPDPADRNHHLYTWTPQLLANMLDEAGFQVGECRVVAYAWPQLHEHLFRLLPRRWFDALARAWAVVLRHRQVMAVATRPEA